MRLPGKHEMAEMTISDDEKRRIVRAEIQRIQEICNDQGLDLDLRIVDRSTSSDLEEKGDAIPDSHWPSIFHHKAQSLVDEAESRGVVVTITQRPTQPFVMGHYDTVVETRPANPNLRKENDHADAGNE